MYNYPNGAGINGSFPSPIQNTSFNASRQTNQRISSGAGSKSNSRHLKLGVNQGFLSFGPGATQSISKTKTAGNQDYEIKSSYQAGGLTRSILPPDHNMQRKQYQGSYYQDNAASSRSDYQVRKEYQDQVQIKDQGNFGSNGYVQKSSSIASRQVFGNSNRNQGQTAQQFQHPLQFLNQKSYDQRKREADQVAQQMEDELLNKFRGSINNGTKMEEMLTPQQTSSVITGISTTITSQKPRLVNSSTNKKLKQSLMEQAAKEEKTIDLREESPKNKDQLNLEESSDDQIEFDFDPDDVNLFKDLRQIPVSDPVTGNHKGRIQLQSLRENSSSIVEIEEGDLEITSEHFKSDSSQSPKKLPGMTLFQQRGKQLNYSSAPGQINNIQNQFYSKYFHQPQATAEQAHIKQLARSNQFLLDKSGRKLPIPAKMNESMHMQHNSSSGMEYNEMNKALYLDKSLDLKECQKMIKRKNWRLLKETEIKKQQEIEKLKKVKLLKRKKKQILKKKEQDKIVNELFNYDHDDENNDKNNKNKNGLGGLLDDESSQSDKPTDEDLEIDLDDLRPDQQETAWRETEDQQELMRQRILMEQQKEFEEKMRLVRFKNRWNVDELIQPLLNLEIIDMYMNEETRDPAMFPVLPKQFQSSGQYFDNWHKLFLYETYNQLINQRNESDKDKEIAKMFGFKLKNDNSNKNFQGLIQKYKCDSKFINLKLSENDNNKGKSSSEVTGNYNSPYPNLDSLKEFDLLLLSKEQLDTKNVKQLTSAKFLKEVQSKQGTMMAIVDGKRKYDKNFLFIRVDISHEKYININCSEYDFHQMYVYYFDSMSTRIREFRTVKSVEFYPNTQFILDPSIIPQRSLPPVQDQSSDKSAESKIKKGPISGPPKNMQKRMKDFVDAHSGKFNESQVKAMCDVSNMNEVDFLLIQGPPGTGKTHTIKGIISMLNQAIRGNSKILVCAPSNAAIDEIVTRLISKGGLFGQTESDSIRKVVRIGALDYEPTKTVQQVMINTKVSKGAASGFESAKDKEMLDQQKQRWIEDIENVEKIINLVARSKPNGHQTDPKIKSLANKILADNSQIDRFMKYEKEKKMKTLQSYQKDVKDKLRMQEEQKRQHGGNMSRTQRVAMEKKIIDSTQIICTTLAMSTNEKLDHLQAGDIDYLIVDEACQSVELNNLIPFEHQPRKVILVGDQQQLPATTFSENAEKTKYSRSMFERFLSCGVDRVMLEVQYRMHPLIREYPSNQFYENRLKDDVSILTRAEDSEFKQGQLNLIQKEFQPIKFYDLAYSTEQQSETSKVNHDEVEFIEQMLKQIILKVCYQMESKPVNIFARNFPKKEYSAEDNKQNRNRAMNELKGLIGIISPYKSQVRMLKDKIFRLLRQYCDVNSPQEFIEINTVDAFQGREKEIIIFSCVRSSAKGNLGFVSDYRRMNVAITRARHCLYVVGNSSTLTRDVNWRGFINFCKNKGTNYYSEMKNKTQAISKTPVGSKENRPTNFSDATQNLRNFNEQLTNMKPEKSEVKVEQQPSKVKPVAENKEKLGLAGMEESSDEQDVLTKKEDPTPKSAKNLREYIKNETKVEKQRASSVDPQQTSQSSKQFIQSNPIKNEMSNKSDPKSIKGDEKSKKSQDKSQANSKSNNDKRVVKDESKQPSVSNQSSSYQSYKPNVVYTKHGDSSKKSEPVNSSSSNKYTGGQQAGRQYNQYGRNDRSEHSDRNTADYPSRGNYPMKQNSDNKRGDFKPSYNQCQRPNDRERDFHYGGNRGSFQHPENFRKENRVNNFNPNYQNRRDGPDNQNERSSYQGGHQNRSWSRDRQFYRKREAKDMYKNNENEQRGHYNQGPNVCNKRPRY